MCGAPAAPAPAPAPAPASAPAPTPPAAPDARPPAAPAPPAPLPIGINDICNSQNASSADAKRRNNPDWLWLQACIGGNPARALAPHEAALLDRASAFDAGHTLVHLAIRYHLPGGTRRARWRRTRPRCWTGPRPSTRDTRSCTWPSGTTCQAAPGARVGAARGRAAGPGLGLRRGTHARAPGHQVPPARRHPARALAPHEAALLDRASAFDAGHTLVHLAIRYHLPGGTRRARWRRTRPRCWTGPRPSTRDTRSCTWPSGTTCQAAPGARVGAARGRAAGPGLGLRRGTHARAPGHQVPPARRHPARALAPHEAALLDRASAFDAGHTLVHLAIRYHLPGGTRRARWRRTRPRCWTGPRPSTRDTRSCTWPSGTTCQAAPGARVGAARGRAAGPGLGLRRGTHACAPGHQVPPARRHPARALAPHEAALLDRASAFDAGHTLVHLAIRFQREDILATLLARISGGGPGLKRSPSYIGNSTRHPQQRSAWRHAGCGCYMVGRCVAEIEELPVAIQEQLVAAARAVEPVGRRLPAGRGVAVRVRRVRPARRAAAGARRLAARRRRQRLQAARLQFALEESQLRADWARLVAGAARKGTPLRQLHVFALAHVARRPILVYGVDVVNSFRGEALGYARFQGEPHDYNATDTPR
ncbi:hypothetical protein MSG28_014367 [Choristoneura fumiferana]|uniref:Uncharacterized protein n=1 Tax=Choristoneura fumiferana TaxID=7141 RepID=A0ACC0JGS9_CHOFU|nr:hypothetical protein MSG28_014367 [Choristoneura fumiferana]